MNGNHTEAKLGISGSTLKIIALVTMLLDHIGAVVLIRIMFDNAAKVGLVGMVLDDELYEVYRILRSIGRFAFPIYCFLLVEGFQRTKNKVNYALRLGLFALLSEIPFDLAFSSKLMHFGYQNVFFTLFLGFITMLAVEAIDNKAIGKEEVPGFKGVRILQWISCLVLVGIGAVIAECLHTDYGANGVLCIMLLYLFRKRKLLQLAAGAISFFWDGIAPFAFIPIGLYNGRRGIKLKYLFYLFYPVHLCILYGVCMIMGISTYSAV